MLEVIKNAESTFDELIQCFIKVKDNGDVGVIKFDGEREEKCYSVFISFPNKNKEMIRADGDDLKGLLRKVLASYLS